MQLRSQQEIRILHVDDNPSFTDLTKTFLEREDDRFAVETAASADEGIEKLCDSPPDCVVSDYNMPGMDGIEFLQAVRDEYPDLPFILYTGKGSEEVASEAIRAGVTDYLQKESGADHYALLANRIHHAVSNQRCEQRIQFFETLEKELTELSIDFLRIDGSDLDTLIDETMKKLGTLVGADRSYVFDIDDEADTLSNTHEWCSGGVDPQIDMLQDLPQDSLAWWMRKLKNLESITISDVSELPPEAEAERELLQEQNIESLIATPLISNEELVGFIGFDWVEEQEAWSEEFIDILRMVGELITTARNRKEREQQLREITDRLNLAVEGANLGVWDWNLQTDTVAFNEQWANMLGLSLDEIDPTLDTWKQRVHPDDIDEVTKALDAHISGEKEYYDTQHRMQTAAGEWKWIRDIGKVVERDGDGKPVRAVGIHLDINEEEERRQELEEFKTIIEALTDAVYVLDEEGRFTHINDEFVELVGYDRQTLIGNTPSLIKDDDSVERGKHQLGRLLSSDGPETVSFEVTVHPRTGDPIVCEDHMGVLPYDGEGFEGSVGVLRDMTEHKEYEQGLEAQNERLDEFTSIVGHDLRSPLSVAESHLKLVEATEESEHLTKAIEAVERSQELINNLLSLAREGDQVGETAAVDIGKMAERSWQTVETRQATLSTVEPGIIEADRSRIRELLENLFRNAVEHGGDDVMVSVGQLSNGFYVADTGPGIPEAERERVFEAGYSTADHGTGFGLRIVEQIADAHRWDIIMTESKRGGARFEFTNVERVD